MTEESKPLENKPLETKPLISYEQFSALDLRVGRVLEASAHPNADKLLVVKVDLGPMGVRQIVAGIKLYYQPEQLVGKLVILVANLQPRMMRGLESQGMLLAASEGEPPTDIIVLTTDKPVSLGALVK
ncbi:MAG: methionine--tRNA ligase subunit beta [Phycisphaerae bacterium]